jgi:hypothetical protein
MFAPLQVAEEADKHLPPPGMSAMAASEKSTPTTHCCFVLLAVALQVGVDSDKNPPPPGMMKALPRCSASSDLLVGQKVRA